MADNTRQIVCGEKGKREGCGTVFTHTQEGRGRPPVYCPSCSGQTYTAKVNTEDTVEVKTRVFLDRTAKVGDTVIRPLIDAYKTFEDACRWATPVKVLSINGDTAKVKHPTEGELTTNLYLLNPVEWR